MNNYSAEALVKKLYDEENIIISTRTLNYYAYDKKMFPDLAKGKNCFTDKEYELLKKISYLKDRTSFTLDEIKTYICDDEKYKNITQSIVSDTVTRGSQTLNSSISFNTENDKKSALDKTFTCCNSITSDFNFCEQQSDDLNTLYKTSTSSPVTNKLNLDNLDYFSNLTHRNVSSNASVNTSYDFTKEQTHNQDDSTVVKINKDVTITVSSNVSRERLIEIINFINSNNKK